MAWRTSGAMLPPASASAATFNAVWTENSTLALRRPFPGLSVGGGTRQPVAYRPCLASEYVHYGSSRSIGCAPTLARARLSLGTGWRTRAAVAISEHEPRTLWLRQRPGLVVQHAAQALPTLDLTRASEVARFWVELPPPSLPAEWIYRHRQGLIGVALPFWCTWTWCSFL
jgi:hypothetical protein